MRGSGPAPTALRAQERVGLRGERRGADEHGGDRGLLASPRCARSPARRPSRPAGPAPPGRRARGWRPACGRPRATVGIFGFSRPGSRRGPVDRRAELLATAVERLRDRADRGGEIGRTERLDQRVDVVERLLQLEGALGGVGRDHRAGPQRDVRGLARGSPGRRTRCRRPSPAGSGRPRCPAPDRAGRRGPRSAPVRRRPARRGCRRPGRRSTPRIFTSAPGHERAAGVGELGLDVVRSPDAAR